MSHPNQEQLAAFGLGRLPPRDRAAIESHIAGCAACCEKLDSLPADSLVKLVQACGGAAATRVPGVDTINDAAATTATPVRPVQAPVELPAELVQHPRYRIIRVLGHGGMGAVYLAEHRVMARLVALKVIRKNLVENAQAVERFRREVKAAARLAHANIVTAHDAEEAGDAHFLVMEYVEGSNLAEVLERRGPMPVYVASHYIRQALFGLQHAHERNMVHRDLKPQNLMLTAEGVVKILDFGLARFASEAADSTAGLTQMSTMMGTPDYMAPEQALDARRADIRADIYSLGCTLYCLLTGRPPFPEGTTMEKVTAHLQQPPRPLTEFGVPKEVAQVAARMMAKSVADRFQTPMEAAEALAPFAPGAPALLWTEDAPRSEATPRPRPGAASSVGSQATITPAASRLGLLGGLLVAGLLGLAMLAAAGIAGWNLLHRRDSSADPSVTPVIRSEPPAPTSSKPEHFEGLTLDVRDRGIAWIRENNKWNPESGVAANVTRRLNGFYDRKECFVESVGSRLLKSGRTTLLAGRGQELFVFVLNDAQAKLVRCPPGAEGAAARINLDRRLVRPHVLLSDLHIDDADGYEGGIIVGSVHYRCQRAVAEELLLRITYHLESSGRWISATQSVGRLSEEGNLPIALTPTVPFQAPDCFVGFFELIEPDESPVRVVSNPQAALFSFAP